MIKNLRLTICLALASLLIISAFLSDIPIKNKYIESVNLEITTTQSSNVSEDINQNSIENQTVYEDEEITSTNNDIEITEETQEPEVIDNFSPKFSMNSGFYKNTISLSLSTETGTAIYYTTDGSIPDNTSTLYTGNIMVRSRSDEPNTIANRTDTSVTPYSIDEPVDKATVIRAVAMDSNGNYSSVITHTYFIGLDITEDYYNTKIVSISTDEENLFDYETGIYVTGETYDNWLYNGGDPYNTEDYFQPANYKNEGKDWERPVNVEIFDTNGNSILSQDLGLRIMGGSSRVSVQKSLKFYARSEYGESKIHCELIPNLYKQIDTSDDIKKFKTFVLRNGGTDHYGMKFRDAFIQTLISDRAVSTQASTPAIAFVNGEYFGVYNLQEDYSDYYIQSHFGVDKDDVLMIKCNEIEEGQDEDYSLYQELLDFVNHQDLSNDTVYQEFCNMVDIQSLIDYFAFECYIDNEDWIDTGNNFRLWRSKTITNEPYQDGKWRWCVYDTEYSMGIFRGGKVSNGGTSRLASLINNKNDDGVNIFIKPLLKNDNFKQQFVLSFMDIANKNFEYNHACEILDTFIDDYSPILFPDSFLRTGPEWYVGSTEDMLSYFNKLANNTKNFLEGRFEYCIDMLKNNLNLEGEAVKISLRVNNSDYGTIQINTITPDFDNNYWSGLYFTDYPVTLTAISSDGHTFTGWTGSNISSIDANKETITVSFSQAQQYVANFE